MPSSQFKRDGKENVSPSRKNLMGRRRKKRALESLSLKSPNFSLSENINDIIDLTISSDDESENLNERKRKKTRKESITFQSSKFSLSDDITDSRIPSNDESSCSSNFEKMLNHLWPPRIHKSDNRNNVDEPLQTLKSSEDNRTKTSKICKKNIPITSKTQNTENNTLRNDSFDTMLRFLLTPLSDDGSAATSSKTSNTGRADADVTFDEILNIFLTPDISPANKSRNLTQKAQPKVLIAAGRSNEAVKSQKILQGNATSKYDDDREAGFQQANSKSSALANVNEVSGQSNGGVKLQLSGSTFLDKKSSLDSSRVFIPKSSLITSIGRNNGRISSNVSVLEEAKTGANKSRVNVTTTKYDPDSEARFKQALTKLIYPNVKSQESSNSALVKVNEINEQQNSQMSPQNLVEKKSSPLKFSMEKSQPLLSTSMDKKTESSNSKKMIQKIIPDITTVRQREIDFGEPKVSNRTSKYDADKEIRFKRGLRKALYPNLSPPSIHMQESQPLLEIPVNIINETDKLKKIKPLDVTNLQGRETNVNNLKENVTVSSCILTNETRFEGTAIKAPNPSCLNSKGTRKLNSVDLSTLSHQCRDGQNSQSFEDEKSKNLKNICVLELLSTMENTQTSNCSQESQFKEMSTQTSFDEGLLVVSTHKKQKVVPCSARDEHIYSQFMESESVRSLQNSQHNYSISSLRRDISSDITIHCCSNNANEMCVEKPLLFKRKHILDILSEDIVVMSDGRKLFNNITKIGTDKWLMYALSSVSVEQTKVQKKEKMIDILETGNTLTIYVDYCTQIQLKRHNNGESKVYQLSKTAASNKCDIPEDCLDDAVWSTQKYSKAKNAQSKLALSIDEICKNSSLRCSDYNLQELDKSKIRIKIHSIFAKLYEVLENDRIPNLLYRRHDTLKDCVFENERLQCGKFCKKSNIRGKKSRFLFCRILYIMGKIYLLLQTNKKLTKRELFYQIKHVIERQNLLDRAIDGVSNLLGLGPWNLNIVTHSGLVYGNIKLFWASGEVTDCNLPATLIPYDLENLVEVQSTASFILVVEKESIFLKLLGDDLPNKLARPFIMITGKGVPDNNTRLFLNRISRMMAVPVFIMVDADVYGIRIMLTYKFGSIANCHLSNELAVPHARWLGVFPSEIKKYGMKHQTLTKRDKNNIHSLLKYPYIEHCPKIATELKFLLTFNKKASIEGLMKSSTFLSESYLPMKFLNKDFI